MRLFSSSRHGAEGGRESSEPERRLSLLVVEDNVLQATSLADVLESAGHHVLGPVRSLREAMRVVEVDHIDAALLDLKLGSENSLRFASTLVKRGTPVLFVSGYPKPAFADFDPRIGYIGKPYQEGDLLRSVSALCSSAT